MKYKEYIVTEWLAYARGKVAGFSIEFRIIASTKQAAYKLAEIKIKTHLPDFILLKVKEDTDPS